MAHPATQPVTQANAPLQCPGSCNSAYRRAWRDHEQALDAHRRAVDEWATQPPDGRPPRPQRPPQPVAQPVLGDPSWCPRCTGAIGRALADLDDLAALAAASADGHRGDAREHDRVTSTAVPSSPSPVHDTLDELLGFLTGVEDAWREHRGYPHRPHRGGRGVHARTACIGWLAGQLPHILANPGSVAFGTGVLGWRARLQAATSSAPPSPRRPGRCPRCDTRALRARDDGIVACAQCARWLSEQEYNEMVTEQAGGAA